jgi:ligand-binding sensor domain-containing protein/signal transduction histidine kinase
MPAKREWPRHLFRRSLPQHLICYIVKAVGPVLPQLRFRLCFAILLSVCGCVQAAEYSHRVWRTEDGLPQNRVQALAQTKDGYLWAGTSEGLARFDGLRFVVYDQSNTAAITDNSILSLEAAPDGSLWIGTEGGGLLHYAGGAFQSFGQKDGLTNGFIRATHLDRHGALWVGTDRGFFRFSNHGFERLDETPQVPLASVVAIAEDSSGKIWAASAVGLLEIEDGKLVRAGCNRAPSAGSAFTISLLREGLIPDGCSAPGIAIPDRPINALRKDASGNIWIGTIGKGLISFNPQTGARQLFSAPAVLPDNTVFLLFEDSQRNIWAAAQDGLVRLSEALVTTVGTDQGLADDDVSTVYEDRERELWLVTFSGQVYRFNGPTPVRYYLPAPHRDLRFRSVFRDGGGDLWFGTAGSGVVRLSHGKATRFTMKEGLRSDSIRQIFEDSKGAMWFATGSGISRWKDGAFTSYYLEQGLSYPSVRCLAETPAGDLLAGTDAGLNRFHDGKIVDDAAFAPLKQEKIWSIYVDGKSLWLGTRGGGLILLRDGRMTRFTRQDGLVSNSIYQIVDDLAGRLWLSSPVGVFSLRRTELNAIADGKARQLHAVAYGSSDGMAASQMFGGAQPAGCRRSSGELWFPSVRGAVKLDPARLPERRSGPALIESVSAADTALPLSGEVSVPPGLGRLQIDFTACNLIAPQQVAFRYRLESFDGSWTVASRQRSAYYSSLPPGHYRFRVVAEDTGTGSASSSEASLAIYIRPTFFQTGWFYSLLAALGICVVWAGMWLYARQTRSRFTLLLNERTRLAREMHDTVIQGCVGVSTLLEAASRFLRTDAAEAAHLLTHARSQVKETLEEARQAVWDLRHSAGNRSPIADLFDLAGNLGKEYGVVVETEIVGAGVPPDLLAERALLLVGREALRNSVSHGRPARISVRIVFEPRLVRMEVRDDGVGFDVAAASLEFQGHYGIIGMRERVEQAGGAFTVSSQPGQGTVVAASVPLRETGSSAPKRSLQNSTIPR